MTGRHLSYLLIPLLGGLLAGTLLPPQSVDFAQALLPPSAQAWAGTDHFGRDLLLGLWTASGQSALFGLITSLATTLLGGALGLGTVFSRLAERVTMAALLITITLPSLLLTFIVAGITGGGRLAIGLTVATTHWPIAAQLIGPRVRREWHAGWTRFDRRLGATAGQILRWHLLPAALGRAATAFIILFVAAIAHEATTAFLAIGVDPATMALGPLIAWGRADIANGAWWTLVLPSAALMLLLVPPAIAARFLGGRTD